MKKYGFLISLLYLSGCGIGNQTTVKIKIDIDSLSRTKRVQNRSSNAELPPSTISDFNCFFVNIRGSGQKNFDPSTIQKVNSGCLGFESISSVTDKDSMIRNGVSLTMARSPASAHSVEVYGISGIDATTSCSEGLSQSSIPQLFLVAQANVGALSTNTVITVSPVYDKDSSVDKNEFCQTVATEVSPIVFSWNETNANAHYSKLYPGAAAARTFLPYNTNKASDNPDFTTSFTSGFTRQSPDATNSFVNGLTISGETLIGIDILFDVNNIDSSRVKKLTLTGSVFLDCRYVTASTSNPSTCYQDYSLNHLVVLTAYSKIAEAWNCVTIDGSDSTILNYSCSISLTDALPLSKLSYSRNFTQTANGAAGTTITRNFVQLSFRAMANSFYANRAVLTITNPKLTYTF